MAGVANRRSVFEQSPLRNRWPRAVFPFSHGAAGARSMDLYPFTYAVMCMAGLENNPEFRSELDEYDEETDLSYLSPYRYQLIRNDYPLFSAIAEKLAQSWVIDEEHCRIGLAGYWTGNPFNLFKPYELWFPKDAYFAWWNQKPRGMSLPVWFSGMRLAEVDKSKEEHKQTGKDRAAHPSLPEIDTRLDNQTVIVEGLTVADVRAMCAHSTPLKSILIATANWHKIPNGYQQKRDDTALETLLSQQAKIDRWGTANDNGVAKEDLPILKRYITGNVKGRGKK